jgi:tripartite-type tricarboxylate transporter receptor subunit TctC
MITRQEETMRMLRLIVAATLSLATGFGMAQSYPDRPVRLIVGFPPGGSSDTVARVVAEKLTTSLGQPVIVENRPGAGGVTASEYVARAPKDGYTLLLATAGHSTAAAMRKELPFDAVRDFTWISTITTYPFVIATAPSAPYSSLGDLVAAAKAAPGKITYSSAGIGTSHHLLGEWLNSEAGIDLVHVPFKGGTSPLVEVVSGRVDVMIETMTLTLPQIRGGKLKALAVTSPESVDFLPGVPPATQTVKGLEFQSWLGLAGPAGLPPQVLERLNRELRAALELPDVRKRLADLGGAAAPVAPEVMRAQVEREIARWSALVEARKIERQ